MGLGKGILKIILIIVNSIVFITSGLTFVFCLLLNVAASVVQQFKDDLPSTIVLPNDVASVWVMVAVSGVVCCLAILGCIGACCESKCLLLTFATIIGALFLAQLGVSIWMLVDRSGVQKVIDDAYTQWWNEDRQSFKEFEKQNQCCGIHGTEDPDCAQLKQQGCADLVYAYINAYSLTSGIVAIVVSCVQLVAAVFSCVLAFSLNSY